nr:putative toxin [Raineya sp.]
IWGNLRVSFRDSLANPVNGVYAPPVVVQANDYDMIGYELPTSKKGSNNYLFQKQERIKDFDLDIDFFKFRPSDSKIGRFWQIDPLSEKYAYNSPYALQENKFGLGIELEGLEMTLFGTSSLFLENTTIVRTPPVEAKPVVETLTRVAAEAATKGTEVSQRSSGKFSPEQLANFRRGNKIEAEQLEQMGLEKNTKPFEAIDPKTGQKGTTVPDAVTDKGETVDVKNVQQQGLSKQMRLQKEISNANGVRPILRINQGAKISSPLKEAGFDIQTYSTPIIKVDNTRVIQYEKIRPIVRVIKTYTEEI